MNVVIYNQQDNIINGLNIEISKAIKGEFKVEDIIKTFSNYFFSRMILDVTALDNYNDIKNYQKLSIGLPTDKIILLIPSGTEASSNIFLSRLISLGYYNFTTNLDGLQYLMQHPNSYRDVAHLHQIQETPISLNNEVISGRKMILGIKNITEGAGATTLTYLLYKELSDNYGVNTMAIEVNKRDFIYFGDKRLLSTTKADLPTVLLKNQSCDIILVDLNDSDGALCTDVLYLVEPSIIKLGKLIGRDRGILQRLNGKKVILNKTLITKSDVKEFEKESKLNIFFTMPPINDRKREEWILQLLAKLHIINYETKKEDI